MNDNECYLMVSGKKIPLTEEQIHLIQADKPKKSPFDRAEKNGGAYYYTDSYFDTDIDYDGGCDEDDLCYECGNYCTDESIMKQHALHMKLNNLLWRYSMTHGGDKIDWRDDGTPKYHILTGGFKLADGFKSDSCILSAAVLSTKANGVIYFIDKETAEAAIEEIVKPFIAAHPDFDVTKM